MCPWFNSKRYHKKIRALDTGERAGRHALSVSSLFFDAVAPGRWAGSCIGQEKIVPLHAFCDLC